LRRNIHIMQGTQCNAMDPIQRNGDNAMHPIRTIQCNAVQSNRIPIIN
jgi:hypothetical protein